LRGKLFLAAQQVGYPANTETLRGLLARRESWLACWAIPTWADFAMADQMIGSPAKLADYLGKIDAASREPGRARMAAAGVRPATRAVDAEDLSRGCPLLAGAVRAPSFSFDSQSVRPYFPTPRSSAACSPRPRRCFMSTSNR